MPNIRGFNKLLTKAYILIEQANRANGKAKSLTEEMGGMVRHDGRTA